MIVVVDASTFVSAAIREGSIPEKALLNASARPHRLILSAAVLAEYREVIFRRKFDQLASIERRSAVLELVIAASQMVEPSHEVAECRDPADDKYLALAAAGSADAIITGDADLLSMHPWRGIAILSPSAFQRRAE